MPSLRRTEKDLLLDSVLSALPEPKAPGQGRSRRRVSTAALTGTPVAARRRPRTEPRRVSRPRRSRAVTRSPEAMSARTSSRPATWLRTGGDEPRVRLIGHVVVVEVEAATGDAVRLGERVQLVEVAIADQMRPQPAVRRPARHRRSGSSRADPTHGCRDTRARAFACDPAIR